MKNTIRFLLAAGAATTALAQTNNNTAARFYVQPSAIVAVPGDDFKTVAGVAIAAGVSFRGNHSIEAEFVRFETEPEEIFTGYDLYFSYALATYKYRFPLNEKFSILAGGSVGLISQEADPRGGYFILGDKTDEAVAVGFSGSVEYALNERISFSAGARVLAQDDTRFTTSGSVAILQGSVKIHF